MYKLTYDSDEEKNIRNTAQQTPSYAGENSSNAPNNENVPQKSRTKDRLKIKRDSTKKFYSLFANDEFVQKDQQTKPSKGCCCSTKSVFIVLFILGLGASVAVFMILEQRLERKIKNLEIRVTDLETAFLSKHNSPPKVEPISHLGGGAGQLKIKPSPLPEADLYNKYFATTEIKFHQIFNSIKKMDSSLQYVISNSKFHDQLLENISRIVDRSHPLLSLLSSEVGYIVQNVKEITDYGFTAWRAFYIGVRTFDGWFDIESGEYLSFLEKDDPRGMLGEGGVFVVKKGGVYFILLKFCTNESAKLMVIKNDEEFKELNIMRDGNTSMISRKQVTLKMNLLKGDAIGLKVISGKLFESSNKSNYCTQIKVYKV